MEVSSVLINGEYYNIKDENTRELINSLQKKVETLKKKSVPLYTVIGKSIPLRPVIGYVYYTNVIKITKKDIETFGPLDSTTFNTGNNFQSNKIRGKYRTILTVDDFEPDETYNYDLVDTSFYKILDYDKYITDYNLKKLNNTNLPISSKNLTLSNNNFSTGTNAFYKVTPVNKLQIYPINARNILSKLYIDILNPLDIKGLKYKYKIFYTRRIGIRDSVRSNNNIYARILNDKFYRVSISRNNDNNNGLNYLRKIISKKLYEGAKNAYIKVPKILIKRRINHRRKYYDSMLFI